jgi:hypothetical protein
MPRRKKPTAQPPTETPTQPQTQIEAPTQVETLQTPQLPFEVRKISDDEYLEYGNEKKESEYAKIARMIVEKALESDSPILVKLPPDLSARKVVPILARIVYELWRSGTKIEFKASYKRNEIAVRVKR